MAKNTVKEFFTFKLATRPRPRNKRVFLKSITVFVVLNLLFQAFYPTIALALTGGPSQPEMQAFTPIGVTNMVDLSSGSFTYNIPLMDVEGYPINLSYHSGITMDQEASWVGLGWNINVGEITRQMRGLPDDFKGDTVTKTFNMKTNYTIGLSVGQVLKIFGFPDPEPKVPGPGGSLTLNENIGIFYNNYKGPGLTFGIAPSLNSGQSNKGPLTASLGVNFNSQSGVDIAPSVGLSQQVAKTGQDEVDLGVKVGTCYNSRSGLKAITMTKDLNVSDLQKTQSGAIDKDYVAGGASVSTSYSFASPSYTPTMTMPMNNYAVTLDVTLGTAIVGAHPDLKFSGYYNEQTLATNILRLPAYGYMNSDAALNNPYALHDFNREKDVPYMQNIANLPITNFTYDLFSVNGQGVSGQFRPFRGDVGVLYDHECSNTSTSGSVGVEFGGPPDLLHGGLQLGLNFSQTTTDQWSANNDFTATVGFQSLQPGNINYEPFYIKSVGEKTINDTAYYNTIGGTAATSVQLDQNGANVRARNILDFNNSTLLVPSNLTKTRREKREQLTSILSAAEANYMGLDKTINSYPYDTNVFGSCVGSHIQHFSRLSWPGHHMSEITVTNPDGKRYVYGIPAYNTTQQEATFAVNTGSLGSNYWLKDSTNIVTYNPGTDNSVSNTNGIDGYFDQQQLPPYAHTYLLTGILSPDYVDLTNDGITDDDLGQAVKLNYTRVYSQANPFRWRTPVEQNSASYQIGLMSYTDDDKANYTYGEKEVWYVHSVESKTMVAQFILENRYDGFGVVDKNGGIDTTKHLSRLKEIILYSKADLIKHGNNAVPIKTVHFVYNYSLCPGVPNSDYAGGSGKLTLTGVYFTYGNNAEGSINSYKFTYSSFNPSYNHNHYDRWGYFKYNPNGAGMMPMPPTEDFSYTVQDSTRTNQFATAWNLTGIRLPSGGNITVKYESNDYGYVQNQRAGQMCLVTGVGNSAIAADSSGNSLYSGLGPQFNDWVFVHLPTAITSTQDFYNKYLAGVDSTNPGGNPVSKLYFRFLVNVGDNTTPAYEYVPGYCDINSYQMINAHMGAIQLKETPPGDPLVNSNSANPIAMASWQFVRLNLPWIAYPGSKVTGSPLSVIEFLLGIVPEIVDIFAGFDERAVVQSFGNNIVPYNSYIRLDNPNYKKLGGGTRVKEIDISDDWASMAAGQSTFQYGQTFKYTNTLPNGQVVSTGVATYEPMVGGDENSLHQPLPYNQKYLLAPNNAMYTETPLGESLYPSPGVVYSKVTVANLYHPGISRTGTGYTVNEFYTAYDFPVTNNWTSITVNRVKPNILTTLLSIGVKDLMNVSQGFAVETNDMAGKEKAEQIYDQTGALISSTQYYYKVDNPNVPNMHLNNDVQTISPSGSITTTAVGEDIDMTEDMREQSTQTNGVDATLNVESFSLWIIPLIIIPIIVPTYSSELTQFRSAVTTKYIHRCGLLDHVIKIQNGSQATTQNILYDGETGEVLLTQTNNEFNKPIYSLTYPAHWAYDGMGPGYENIGLEVAGITTNSGGQIPATESPGSYFAPGDEIEYYTHSGLSSTKGWVTCPQPGIYVVMDVYGNPISMPSPGYTVKIIRSGRRNMSNVPIGKLQSMVSPITAGLNSLSASTNILQASATTFNNLWQIPYNSVETPVCVTTTVTPDSCFVILLDSLMLHHQLLAPKSAGITYNNYFAPSLGTVCWVDNLLPYYALTEPVGEDQMSGFQAVFGNNTLTFSSVSGNPISFDSLTPYYDTCNAVGYVYRMSISNGCLNLYKRYMPPICKPPVIATVCITHTVCHDSCENLAVNNTFNPYAQGVLGSWRPQANYVYYYSRSPSLASTTSNIWNTGVFNHFTPAWTGSGIPWSLSGVSDSNWVWTSKVTKYDQKGNEVEDIDALDRYSSALYGYVSSLPVAVASNAKYKDIAFDGFEDYGFSNSCSSPCDNTHFSYITYISDTTSTEAHTGKYSLKLAANSNASVTRNINYYNGAIDSATNTSPYKYILLNGGNIPLFSPDNGAYLLSAWVKESAGCGITGYTKDSIVVSYTGSSLTYVMKPAGPVIEGWQRFENKFTVPPSATAITVKLVAGSNTAYYDDIRMEPFAAEMKTYVYDPSSLRLMATLDENNYATIYEYNDEGILLRVKKETEKGVMTIKESRSSYPRHY